MSEPANSLWRRAIHEASHATMAYIQGAEVGGIRLHAQFTDCEVLLAGDTEPTRKALKGALVALAGVEGEALYCGRQSEKGQTDLEVFAKDVQRSGLFSGWAPEVARMALGAVTRRLLKAHERLVFDLANLVAQQRHVYAQDIRSQLAFSAKFWGIKVSSPLMEPNWRESFMRALDDAAGQMEEDRVIDQLVRKINRHEERVSR
jgi:hypothetical protein